MQSVAVSCSHHVLAQISCMYSLHVTGSVLLPPPQPWLLASVTLHSAFVSLILLHFTRKWDQWSIPSSCACLILFSVVSPGHIHIIHKRHSSILPYEWLLFSSGHAPHWFIDGHWVDFLPSRSSWTRECGYCIFLKHEWGWLSNDSFIFHVLWSF